MRATKSCGRACQTVTSCARLPTVSGSPGGDAYIQGRPRRTSCPVRACSTGPRETRAPRVLSADARSLSVWLVPFHHSRRALTLQSQPLPRGHPIPIRLPCSLQLCRERLAPLCPVERAPRKRKRRRVYIPTRRKQPAASLVNRTHLVDGRRPNATHGRPAHGLDYPRNRAIAFDNQASGTAFPNIPRRLCFRSGSLVHNSPGAQVTNHDDPFRVPFGERFHFFVRNDISGERLVVNSERTSGASRCRPSSQPASKHIGPMPVSARIDSPSFFSRQSGLIHDRLRVSNDHFFMRAGTTWCAVLSTSGESRSRQCRRLGDRHGDHHTSDHASQPHCNCAENGCPSCVQYSVLPARASDNGSKCEPEASSLLPVLSTARTSNIVGGPVPPTVGPTSVSTIHATAPSLFTTRSVALPSPTSPGTFASPVGASRMTRPLRKSRTKITNLARPPGNTSSSSYATILPASVSPSTPKLPPGPPVPLRPSRYGRCP